jgi:hypothetical protein
MESSCDFSRYPIAREPFVHVLRDQFIDPQNYVRVCESFPTCPAKIGPTGYSLYWGDEDYERLLKSEAAWQQLFATFHSQRFIDWCRDQFADIWEQEGCLIDLAKARYVPYREDRIDKERPSLRKVEYEPDELWVRMDIHQGQLGYDRPIHLDHARRLLSMLIYMCDSSENQMSGGDLLLHGSSVVTVTPRHNRMVAFPCSVRSHHSVSKITAQRSPRNYVQVHISSSVDIWPRPLVPKWRRLLSGVKRSVKDLVQ